jgi:hypothetical protein
MGKQVTSLMQAVCSIQSALGTEATSLSTFDVAEVMEGSKLGFTAKTSPIALVGAGFSQNASVRAPSIADVTLVYPMRTSGAQDTETDLQRVLQCSGLLLSGPTSHKYTYAPTSIASSMKDMTVWGYSGDMSTTAAYKRILYNCMFNPKITLDFQGDGYAKAEFSGKGVYKGPAAAATQLAVTKDAGIVQPLRGVTLNFFGDTDFDLLKLEFDFGQEVAVTAKPTDPTGLGLALITKRLIKWSATVYRDTAADAETLFSAGTLGTISCAWGTAPNKITIATGALKAQITEIADGDTDGVETYELSGIVVDNSISLEFDTTSA